MVNWAMQRPAKMTGKGVIAFIPFVVDVCSFWLGAVSGGGSVFALLSLLFVVMAVSLTVKIIKIMLRKARRPQVKKGTAIVNHSASIPPRPGPTIMPKNHVISYKPRALPRSWGATMSTIMVLRTGQTIPEAVPCSARRSISWLTSSVNPYRAMTME